MAVTFSQTTLNLPGNGTNDASTGADAWNNPGNITGGSDVNYSHAAIPGSFGNVNDNLVRLSSQPNLANAIGDNKSTGTWSSINFTTATYGGVDDKWGLSSSVLTPALVNSSNFSLLLQAAVFLFIDIRLTQILVGSNFGFSIPSDARIAGVTAKIRRQFAVSRSSIQPRVAWMKMQIRYAEGSGNAIFQVASIVIPKVVVV